MVIWGASPMTALWGASPMTVLWGASPMTVLWDTTPYDGYMGSPLYYGLRTLNRNTRETTRSPGTSRRAFGPHVNNSAYSIQGPDVLRVPLSRTSLLDNVGRAVHQPAVRHAGLGRSVRQPDPTEGIHGSERLALHHH